jgi:hypothetical protein
MALLLASGSVSAAPKKPAKEAASADPNVEVAKTHGGKVWVSTDNIPSLEGDAMGKWLAAHPANPELSTGERKDRWVINFLAVFKKAPAKGPMTVQFVDKKDPKVIVDQVSPQTPGGSLVYQEGYDLEQDNGFNKGHSYIIKVGQLIKKKFEVDATGEFTLK